MEEIYHREEILIFLFTMFEIIVNNFYAVEDFLILVALSQELLKTTS